MLLPYNLIRQEIATPIQGHGQCLFDDGRMAVLRAESDEPARVHPVQVWQTPFVSAEYAAQAPSDGSFLGRLGNAELVRAVSELFALERMVADLKPARSMRTSSRRAALGTYPWLGKDEAGGAEGVVGLRRNAELIIDEFAKLQALQTRAEALEKPARTRPPAPTCSPTPGALISPSWGRRALKTARPPHHPAGGPLHRPRGPGRPGAAGGGGHRPHQRGHGHLPPRRGRPPPPHRPHRRAGGEAEACRGRST